MTAPARCDFCLQPYSARAGGFECVQDCPSQRGEPRRKIRRRLREGDIPLGLHPSSRLVREAREQLEMTETAVELDIGASLQTILLAAESIRELQQRKEELRRLQGVLRGFAEGDDLGNQPGTVGQPELEPSEDGRWG